MRAGGRWDEWAREHEPPADGVFICRRRRPTARDTKSAHTRSTSARPQLMGRPSVQPITALGAPQRAADGTPRCGPSCACVNGGAQGAAGPPEREVCPRPPREVHLRLPERPSLRHGPTRRCPRGGPHWHWHGASCVPLCRRDPRLVEAAEAPAAPRLTWACPTTNWRGGRAWRQQGPEESDHGPADPWRWWIRLHSNVFVNISSSQWYGLDHIGNFQRYLIAYKRITWLIARPRRYSRAGPPTLFVSTLAARLVLRKPTPPPAKAPSASRSGSIRIEASVGPRGACRGRVLTARRTAHPVPRVLDRKSRLCAVASGSSSVSSSPGVFPKWDFSTSCQQGDQFLSVRGALF